MTERSDDRGGQLVGLRHDRRGGSFLDDFISSMFAVVGIGILLFAVSGVWPPMVAIESPSMEPNIDTGDLVFVMEEHRFASDHQIKQTGVVSAYRGRQVGYGTFNNPGDVIIFAPNGDTRATPVIHRAAFWVNKSENWYDKADQRFIGERTSNCEELSFCPAPNRGFITLGDNNPQYDQIQDPRAVTRPVKPEWIIGTAEFNMPAIGFLRLRAGAVSPMHGVRAAATLAG